MKALLFACGLLATGGACAATLSGSIDVRLTIYTQCQVDGQHATVRGQPTIRCGQQPAAQPKVTLSTLEKEAKIKQETRLITVEW
ncbi:hypothetical protein [Mixta gaviniae]|uniref:Lipoprotein n=1 Tax=Mixta gaviniae TaxID=665914 RepID=A0A1X1CZN9_9GAMM|nr:hypothetical protein [Mixta gaviniae]AUX92446.1 hypothetical protein C2E15_04690 [Mixta gaviniae]ORM69895.1 hypothetical protein HA44_21125 [Mixta gaviniae]